MSPKLKFSLAAVAFILLFVIGLSAYAYSAVSVTMSSPLFGLKQAAEGAQLALAASGLPKVEVYTQLANRRLAEAKYLSAFADFKVAYNFELIASAYAQEGADYTPVDSSNLEIVQTLKAAEDDNAAAIKEANQIIQTDEAASALAVIETASTTQETVLSDIAGNVGLKNDAVTNSVALALEKVKNHKTAIIKAKENVKAAAASGQKAIKVEIKDDEDENGAEKEPAIKIDATALASDLEKIKIAWQENQLQFGDYSEIDVTKLLDRVNSKLDKVQAAIDSGNLNQAQGLLKAAQALQNNGRHFIRKIGKIGDNDYTKINETNTGKIKAGDSGSKVPAEIKDRRQDTGEKSDSDRKYNNENERERD